MLLEDVKQNITIDLGDNDCYCRIKGCSRMKKEFNRTFFKDRELSAKRKTVKNLRESLNLEIGLNDVSKENILNLIKQ